jgi:hypothetical protein
MSSWRRKGSIRRQSLPQKAAETEHETKRNLLRNHRQSFKMIETFRQTTGKQSQEIQRPLKNRTHIPCREEHLRIQESTIPMTR